MLCLHLILSGRYLHVKLGFDSVGIKAGTAFCGLHVLLRRKTLLINNNKFTGFREFTRTWFCTCGEDSLVFATFLREKAERHMAISWHYLRQQFAITASPPLATQKYRIPAGGDLVDSVAPPREHRKLALPQPEGGMNNASVLQPLYWRLELFLFTKYFWMKWGKVMLSLLFLCLFSQPILFQNRCDTFPTSWGLKHSFDLHDHTQQW